MRPRRTGRVLVLRPDHLGDMVLFSGAWRLLREHYPRHEIVVAASAAGTEYLRHCPHVDRLIPFSPRVRRRVALLRRHWSVVLAPVRSPTARQHYVVGILRASEKHGIAGDLSRQDRDEDRAAAGLYTSRLQLDDSRKTDPELLVTRDYLRHLGIDAEVEGIWPETWTTPEDREWAARCVPRRAGRSTLALVPEAGLKGKEYPAALYGSVLAGLGDVSLDVVLFGTSRNAHVCTAVAAAISGCAGVGSVTNLAGATTVAQLVEGLRRADAVLAVDSAPLHIATALRRPVVGILGGGHFGRFFPWGDPATTWMANKPMDCYWCKWSCRYETRRCIEEIPPASIADPLRSALRVVRS